MIRKVKGNNAPRKKHKYPTDTEAGIRTLPQIRKLPAGELTDDEHCKMFFDRFGAKALIMVYIDENGQPCSFGRLKHGAQPFKFYKELSRQLNEVWERANVKEMESEEDHKDCDFEVADRDEDEVRDLWW